MKIRDHCYGVIQTFGLNIELNMAEVRKTILMLKLKADVDVDWMMKFLQMKNFWHFYLWQAKKLKLRMDGT